MLGEEPVEPGGGIEVVRGAVSDHHVGIDGLLGPGLARRLCGRGPKLSRNHGSTSSSSAGTNTKCRVGPASTQAGGGESVEVAHELGIASGVAGVLDPDGRSRAGRPGDGRSRSRRPRRSRPPPRPPRRPPAIRTRSGRGSRSRRGAAARLRDAFGGARRAVPRRRRGARRRTGGDPDAPRRCGR